MSKLEACGKEFEKAYRRHLSAYRHMEQGYTGATESQHMLYFYTIECGLKAVFFKQNKIPKNSFIPECIYSHKLVLILKELRIPISIKISNFRAKSDRSKLYDLSNVHTAWRYGVDIYEQDQETILEWLNAMKERIAEDII